MKILVAIDGSPYTAKAIEFLAANRAMFVEGNELVLVHVCPSIPGRVARHVSKEDVDAYYNDERAKAIDPAKTLLAEHKIENFSVEARQGFAVDEILETAHRRGAGMIVMGTRGHGLLGRALLGSVSSRVVLESELPVLLIK